MHHEKQINPFFAILFMTMIGATGTIFVVHKIFQTDFTYAYEDSGIDVTP